MDATTQEWLVYIIVAGAALMLLLRLLRRRQACQSCPLHEISHYQRSGAEPSGPTAVDDEAAPANPEGLRSKGDD